MENKTKCYIYTRVSTVMQIDGFSLNAQRKKLEGYAEFNGMEVAGEYTDEGKSGKNIEGRPAFKQMLYDIETCKDDVSFVLVFKLSRFGRNVADVLSSLQLIQDYGVNLVSVEEGLDSSKEMSKLMITILSAVAEIERENILVQTMEGRKQKAREGKWNGGFAPYGYKLVNGELVIEENEAEAIRIIFDKYANTSKGIRSIMRYLYSQGIEKVVRENGKLDFFSESFIKSVIRNPVYAGKIAYGRRKTEKIKGSRNEFHTVKSDDYLLYDGIHEAIVDEDTWNAAQTKLDKRKTKRDYTARNYIHILSGLVKCPVCGAGMYGNICNKTRNGKKSQYFYYGCKHRRSVDEIACGYKKQIEEKRLNAAVVEVIKGLVKNKKFATIIKEKINTEIDTSQMDAEIKNYKKQLSQKNGAVEKIKEKIVNIPLESKNYDRMFQTYEDMIAKIYDDITSIEQDLEDVMERKRNIEKDKLTADKIYKYLLAFDELYETLEDVEKKELIRALVEEVQIHEEKKENGQWLKGIRFKFPIAPDGNTVHEVGLDNQDMFEGVCLLSKVQK